MADKIIDAGKKHQFKISVAYSEEETPAEESASPAGNMAASAATTAATSAISAAKTPASKSKNTPEEKEDYKLVEISPNGGDQKWYVNLDPNESEKAGREITIKAKLDKPMSGINIYFAIDNDPNNRKDLPSHIAPKLSADSQATNAQGEAQITLTTSRYGGDKIRVVAGLTPEPKAGGAGALNTAWFETWRRVFYEIDFMKKELGSEETYEDSFDLDKFEAEYKKYFVEIIRIRKGSMDYIHLTYEDRLYEIAKPHCQTVGEPRFFHAAVFYSYILPYKDAIVKKIPLVHKGLSDSRNTNLGVKDVKPAILKNNKFKVIWGKNINYIIDFSGGWFIRGFLYGRVNGVKKEIEIPPAFFKMSEVGNDYYFEVDLSDPKYLVLLKNIKEPEMKVEIKIWSEGSGLQSDRFIAVGMKPRLGFEDSSTRCLRTMIHEAGHAMGLASTTQIDGSLTPTYYKKGGHHCENNENTCVMHGESSANTEMCDNCFDPLKGRDLSKLPIDGEKSI